jgi:hypothetical protein
LKQVNASGVKQEIDYLTTAALAAFAFGLTMGEFEHFPFGVCRTDRETNPLHDDNIGYIIADATDLRGLQAVFLHQVGERRLLVPLLHNIADAEFLAASDCDIGVARRDHGIVKRFPGCGANGEPVGGREVLSLLITAQKDHPIVGENAVNVEDQQFDIADIGFKLAL